MPSERKHRYGLHIYSANKDFPKLLNTLKKGSGLTYRDLLRQMIEEVSASEKLREKVHAYYKTHGAYWADVRKVTETRISTDKETMALAEKLAFQLCGNGNRSELGQLLIRFYAVEGDTAAKYASPTGSSIAEAHQAISPKRNIVSIRSHGKKDATSLMLDVETVSLLALLVQNMHIKSNDLVIHLTEKYAAKEGLLKKLSRSPGWEVQIAAVNPVVKRFNFSEQIVELLTSIAFKAIGTSNKSAMIRGLIRIESDLRGLSVKTSHRREE